MARVTRDVVTVLARNRVLDALLRHPEVVRVSELHLEWVGADLCPTALPYWYRDA